MGPFHGLLISLKGSFSVKGYQAITGFVSFAAHPPATNNSAVVEILLKAVAVCYVKTNVPQTMMCSDTVNNVFGRPLNPNKLSLTAGSSTGGEVALLKMRGSVLGIGTDMAGSVRIPALCNGVFGLNQAQPGSLRRRGSI
jgi:amidase